MKKKRLGRPPGRTVEHRIHVFMTAKEKREWQRMIKKGHRARSIVRAGMEALKQGGLHLK